MRFSWDGRSDGNRRDSLLSHPVSCPTNGGHLPHLHLYARVARELGFAPTRQMLDWLPEAAPLMVFRHEPVLWQQMRTEVHLLYPDIAAWTSKIADDGTALHSVPERLVYDDLMRLRVDGVTFDTHPMFEQLFEADFGLRCGSSRAFVEVLGMLERDRAPCNDEAARYQRKADRKRATYAAHGATLTLIYLDDICHRRRLGALLNQTIEQLGKAA